MVDIAQKRKNTVVGRKRVKKKRTLLLKDLLKYDSSSQGKGASSTNEDRFALCAAQDSILR